MELLNPSHEKLKNELETHQDDFDDVVADVEIFQIPVEIAPTPDVAPVEPTIEEILASRHEIIGPTYAKRSKYLSGMALNSLTYDEIMRRK